MRWSIARIHAGRSHRFAAASLDAITTAVTPSAFVGQSCSRSGSATFSVASRSVTVYSPRVMAFGLDERVAPAADRHLGHLRLGDDAGLEARPGLQRGQRSLVGPERRDHVRIELQRHCSVHVTAARLAVAEHQRDVALARLDLHPGFVERPGAVHLDVALDDRWPRSQCVDCGDEAERLARHVVATAVAPEADVAPFEARASEHLGHDRHDHLDRRGGGVGTVRRVGDGDDRDVTHQRWPA